MNRRTFAQSVGAGAVLSALAEAQSGAPGRKTGVYRLDYLYCRQGEQTNRINDFVSAQLPVLTKNTLAYGIFNALVGPHLPTTLILRAYSGLEAKPKTPRVFELRVYHSPTQRQLQILHQRFAGPEIGIFHRCGIYPILYANTLVGQNMPNLTYFMPFASLADREKAWDAFGADPDWVKARAESIAKGGQVVAESTITLWRPTPFSPIQ
jgi:hypothetical protein